MLHLPGKPKIHKTTLRALCASAKRLPIENIISRQKFPVKALCPFLPTLFRVKFSAFLLLPWIWCGASSGRSSPNVPRIIFKSLACSSRRRRPSGRMRCPAFSNRFPLQNRLPRHRPLPPSPREGDRVSGGRSCSNESRIIFPSPFADRPYLLLYEKAALRPYEVSRPRESPIFNRIATLFRLVNQ